ncbi:MULTISPECIES: acyl carrier protein [Actinoalloteichus]|uniref:Acyl carrier protein n=1 Tax=Actinoalloteichus caeruleus DSM 43889 TaxID=1120930 RepID=A0ABT1JC98_ACTCY|nr:phosphopantetheine-binding protein [Actinoalloteichus caeruleus]MCP2330117.1 Acyl carrier protein [Actinoalloteichus caeruleus DSM 43889]
MNHDHDHLEDSLRDLLVSTLELGGARDSVPGRGLLDTLGLDSVSCVRFLLAVEREFDIEIGDDDLTPQLVDDLTVLADYVRTRTSPSNTR